VAKVVTLSLNGLYRSHILSIAHIILHCFFSFLQARLLSSCVRLLNIMHACWYWTWRSDIKRTNL